MRLQLLPLVDEALGAHDVGYYLTPPFAFSLLDPVNVPTRVVPAGHVRLERAGGIRIVPAGHVRLAPPVSA